MAVTLVATIALGHLLGGPARETRTVLAVASAMRNPGLALLVVQLNFTGRGVEGVVLAYVLMTLLLLTGYVAWWRRAGRGAAAS
jgi:BASS family bile acid:Na+ symporter